MLEALLPLGAWLLAYLVHSTVWLGGAWLLLRASGDVAPGLRELTWRVALCGSLLTPTAQWAATAHGWQPLGGTLAWMPGNAVSAAPAEIAAPIATHPAPAGSLPVIEESVAQPAQRALLVGVLRSIDDLGLVAEPQSPADWPLPADTSGMAAGDTGVPAGGGASGRDVRVLGAFTLVWIVGAGVGLLRLILGAWTLRRRLRDRRTVSDGPLMRMIERQLRPAGPRAPRVRLSTSSRLPVPIAFGWMRPEICMPVRAVASLDADQQRAMIGHELCHLLRRDPVWLGFYLVVQRAFFLQPLNAVAHRQATAAAEEICDAWSARRTGRPDAMAGCLAQVADWFVTRERPAPPLAAACMARPGSPLGRRIERLLDPARRSAAAGTPRRARFGIVAAACAGAALLVGVTPAVAAASSTTSAVTTSAPPDGAAEELELPASADLARQRVRFLRAEIAELERLLAQDAPTSLDRAQTILRLESLRARLARLDQLMAQLASRLGVAPVSVTVTPADERALPHSEPSP